MRAHARGPAWPRDASGGGRNAPSRAAREGTPPCQAGEACCVCARGARGCCRPVRSGARRDCCLAESVRRRRLLLAAPFSQIRADIEVTCFHYEGINAIKGALLKGVEMGSDDLPVKIKLVAPPLYVMLCSALDKSKGIALLSKAIEVMKEDIQKNKGDLQVKAQPRAVDERDDKLLANLMTTLENQNMEIDGDDDEEENEEGMGAADVS